MELENFLKRYEPSSIRVIGEGTFGCVVAASIKPLFDETRYLRGKSYRVVFKIEFDSGGERSELGPDWRKSECIYKSIEKIRKTHAVFVPELEDSFRVKVTKSSVNLIKKYINCHVTDYIDKVVFDYVDGLRRDNLIPEFDHIVDPYEVYESITDVGFDYIGIMEMEMADGDAQKLVESLYFSSLSLTDLKRHLFEMTWVIYALQKDLNLTHFDIKPMNFLFKINNKDEVLRFSTGNKTFSLKYTHNSRTLQIADFGVSSTTPSDGYSSWLIGNPIFNPLTNLLLVNEKYYQPPSRGPDSDIWMLGYLMCSFTLNGCLLPDNAIGLKRFNVSHISELFMSDFRLGTYEFGPAVNLAKEIQTELLTKYKLWIDHKTFISEHLSQIVKALAICQFQYFMGWGFLPENTGDNHYGVAYDELNKRKEEIIQLGYNFCFGKINIFEHLANEIKNRIGTNGFDFVKRHLGWTPEQRRVNPTILFEHGRFLEKSLNHPFFDDFTHKEIKNGHVYGYVNNIITAMEVGNIEGRYGTRGQSKKDKEEQEAKRARLDKLEEKARILSPLLGLGFIEDNFFEVLFQLPVDAIESVLSASKLTQAYSTRELWKALLMCDLIDESNVSKGLDDFHKALDGYDIRGLKIAYEHHVLKAFKQPEYKKKGAVYEIDVASSVYVMERNWRGGVLIQTSSDVFRVYYPDPNHMVVGNVVNLAAPFIVGIGAQTRHSPVLDLHLNQISEMALSSFAMKFDNTKKNTDKANVIQIFPAKVPSRYSEENVKSAWRYYYIFFEKTLSKDEIIEAIERILQFKITAFLIDREQHRKRGADANDFVSKLKEEGLFVYSDVTPILHADIDEEKRSYILQNIDDMLRKAHETDDMKDEAAATKKLDDIKSAVSWALNMRNVQNTSYIYVALKLEMSVRRAENDISGKKRYSVEMLFTISRLQLHKDAHRNFERFVFSNSIGDPRERFKLYYKYNKERSEKAKGNQENPIVVESSNDVDISHVGTLVNNSNVSIKKVSTKGREKFVLFDESKRVLHCEHVHDSLDALKHGCCL